MSGQDYTPAGAAFPAFPWTLVKDGEQYNFDSIQQSADPKKGLIAKCMDAIAFLKARSDKDDSNFGAPAIAITRTLDGNIVVPTAQASNVTIQSTGNPAFAVNTAAFFLLPLSPLILPHGAALTSVNLSILPANHVTFLPGTMPNIQLWYFDTLLGPTQVGATTTDTSANVTAYNLQHTLTITAAHTVDRTSRRYWLELHNEAGSNAVSGLLSAGGSVVFTR